MFGRAITLACVLTSGCGSAPVRPENTCGQAPRPLSSDLTGTEFVYRARAWESYALCVQELLEPAPPIVIPAETPEEVIERERQRREIYKRGEVRGSPRNV